MKKQLPFLFLLTFLYCFHAFSQQAHFSQPDIWLLPESSGSRTLMRVNTPDTSYYLSVQDTCGRLINYQPAIVWDTSMHPLRIPYNNTSGFEQTAFVAYHCKDSLNEYGIWLLERDSIWHNSQTTRRFIKSKGATEYQNGGMDMPVINTSVQAWAKSRSRNKEYAFILGQSRSCDSVFIPFSGLLAESLVYGECPDRRQTGIIQTYLALKYGISLIANNYVDCRDSILWDYRRDSAYISGIAGLGKDSLSGLDQKQSHSTSEPLFLGISAGHFSVSNGENRSVLQQNDYLLWGHDCGELQVAGSGSDFYPYAHPLLARRWLIRPYGNMRHTPTEAVIHAGALSGVSGPYRLAIDRSGTGNFESVFTEYIPADSVSASGEVFFSNIYWDVDSSGSDLFTIATGASLLCRIQNPSCSNHADGILDIELVGGVSPYRYLLTHTGNHQRWRRQSGQRIQQFSSLPAGEYILEAYDSENRYLKKEGISLRSLLSGRLGAVRAALRDRRAMGAVFAGSVFGPFLGVSLSLMAVQYASTAVASTIMATTPILILVPYLLFRRHYNKRITGAEIAGAVLSVVGVSLFFL